MFQSKKQQQANLSNIRLTKLPASPGFADLQYALVHSQKNSRRTIELPWTSTETHTPFMLALRSDSAGGDPSWTMYAGDGEDARVLWSYSSGDMQLILNLALTESSGGKLQDITQAGSYMATAKPQDGKESSSTTGNYQPVQGTPTTEVLPVQTETGKRARSILEGDLKNMQVPNLLQSVVLSQMTGRLCVQSAQGTANIFFEEGVPVHAEVGTSKGDLSMIELLMWCDGQFQFFHDEHGTARSINKRLDSLLMEGMALLDQNRYISAQGVTPQSYLLRKNPNLSEAQFEQMVAHGAPLDLPTQKRFYQAIDNKSTLFELLRRLPLDKTEWIPLMFNMLSCSLITATETKPHVARDNNTELEPIKVDQSVAKTVIKALKRTETELFTFPAMLYFLQQEVSRFEAFGWPFSLVVFEMRFHQIGSEDVLEPLPSGAVRELAHRIATVKRPTDLIGHYETFDYACILPNTNIAGAAMFTNRLSEVLQSEPVSMLPEGARISLALGVASIPEDCRDLGLILAAAHEAKNHAKERKVPIILFRDRRQV